jgi:amino acid transporter
MFRFRPSDRQERDGGRGRVGANHRQTGAGSGLNAFGGVYTPSILTILGVIMYLRFGWVLGNVGLGGTLLIVTLATAITLLTSLSVAAIATDRTVRAGGAYYMIGRSLGIEIGGAVGIPLYLAQALSIALYTLGFAESVVETFGGLSHLESAIAFGITILIAGLAIKSAQAAIKAQYLIMAAIAFSLIAVFFGQPVTETPLGLTGSPPESSASFWQVFAVFFPAVTGIMAGVNMSGDLKNPDRAIPWGTLAAVGTGYLIYMTLPIVLALRVDAQTLINEPLVMQRVAFFGPAIQLGVWGATLSSALGSILAAPRVLQALARDGILPRWLGPLGGGSGPNDEPRLGTVVTLGVAIAAVTIGDLNAIAPVLTMFFLTTYLVLNVSAGIESFLESPSFRPSFSVHWSLSLVGAVGCGAAMFLIDAMATVVAAAIVLAIYIWLERRELESAWGDVRRGIWMALVRAGIRRLDAEVDAKNWRPHVLVLSGAPRRRWPLVELASAFTHNRGLITVASVLTQMRDISQQGALEQTIHEYLAKKGVHCLVRVIAAPDPFAGTERLVEVYGLGPLVPNTVILGDSEDAGRRDRYCQSIATIHRSRRNVVIVRDDRERLFGKRSRIDVWWGGLQANGGLMMILAYLMRTSNEWRHAQVNVKLVVPNQTAATSARNNLNNLVAQMRIEAHPHVIIAQSGNHGGTARTFDEILHETSQDADLIFLGMAPPSDRFNFTEYYEDLHRRTANLPSTLFVLAAPDFSFSEVLSKE